MRHAHSSSYFQFVNPYNRSMEKVCVDCIFQIYLAAQTPKGGGVYQRIIQKLVEFFNRLTAGGDKKIAFFE
jgi:hypothetical protein